MSDWHIDEDMSLGIVRGFISACGRVQATRRKIKMVRHLSQQEEDSVSLVLLRAQTVFKELVVMTLAMDGINATDEKEYSEKGTGCDSDVLVDAYAAVTGKKKAKKRKARK